MNDTLLAGMVTGGRDIIPMEANDGDMGIPIEDIIGDTGIPISVV